MANTAKLSSMLVLDTVGFSASIDKAVDKWASAVKQMEQEAAAVDVKTQRGWLSTVKRMEKDTGVSFEQMRREMGAVGSAEMSEPLVQRQAAEFARSMRQRENQGLGSDLVGVRTMSRGEAMAATYDKAVFSIRGMAKGLGLAAAGIEAANVLTSVFSGRWDEAADKVKNLPFGIGHVATSLESVLGAWTGITKEIENQKASAEGLTRVIEQQRSVLDRIKDTHRETAAYIEAANQETADYYLGNTAEGAAARAGRSGAAESRRLVRERDEAIKAVRSSVSKQQDALKGIPQQLVRYIDNPGVVGGTHKVHVANPAYEQAIKSLESTQSQEAKIRQDYAKRIAANEERTQAAKLTAQGKFYGEENEKLRKAKEEQEKTSAEINARALQQLGKEHDEGLRRAEQWAEEEEQERKRRGEQEWSLRQQAEDKAKSWTGKASDIIANQKNDPMMAGMRSRFGEDRTQRIQQAQDQKLSKIAQYLKEMRDEQRAKDEFVANFR
jgi:hypothetical protein